MPHEIVARSDLRDRVARLAGSRREAWVVAGVAGAVVIAGLVLFGRSATAVVAPPALPPTTLPEAGGVLTVHVAGAVKAPGLYELPDGERVADAIEAAGGPRKGADLNALNLAEPLGDGVQIYVSRRGGNAAPGEVPPVPGATSSPTAVDVNSADATTLEQIPGIGPVKAQAIVEYRAGIGTFDTLDQLLDVTGIGPATLESMRPYVTL